MIISQFPSGSGGAPAGVPQFTYTGEYKIVQDATGWKVRFLTSGTLEMVNSAVIDVFLVGGGGNGSPTLETMGVRYGDNDVFVTTYGGGGGGGHTLTKKNLTLASGKKYDIVVGSSAGASSITPQDSSEWTGESYSASGGDSTNSMNGGNGGSGGSSGSYYSVYQSTRSYYAGSKKTNGGTDGADGSQTYGGTGGTGQGTTTREFGEADGALYAGGGNAVCSEVFATPYQPNTGRGGDGGVGSYGSSGIVIIRNKRA